MAITKLLHIKETSGTRPNSEGLKNAINYVLNPEKTQNGYLTGSNCGMNAEEAYAAFMDTKGCYGKYDGRQGYHFIISFDEKDNVSHGVMLNVMAEFAERYLGEDFDYVYSVHDDKGHTHGHLVFNSVNRNTGYKYRYEKGDWAKYIQPVTDKICEEYGLRQLEVLQHGKEKEQGNTNWEAKIKYDIDDCINNCVSYEDYISQMEEIYGYDLREGVLKKYGHYIAYKPVGKPQAVRSYRLGQGYSPSDINRRIKNNNRRNKGERFIPPDIENVYIKNQIGYLKSTYLKWDNMSSYQKSICVKWMDARKMYGSIHSTKWENERNVAAINAIMKEFAFIMKHEIRDVQDLEKRAAVFEVRQNEITERLDGIKSGFSEHLKGKRGRRSDFNLYKEYVGLYKRLQTAEKDDTREIPDKIKMEMEKIEDIIDVEEISAAFDDYQNSINECLKELKENKYNKKMTASLMKHVPDKKEKEQKENKEHEAEKERKRNQK